MLRNYLLTICNNIRRNKLYSLINLTGLSLGLTSCLLITLYVISELSYDRHWQNANDIYRLNYSVDSNGTGEMQKFAFQPLVTLPLLREFFNEEIELGARVYSLAYEIQSQDAVFEEGVARIDPDLIDIFEMETVAGDLTGVAADNSQVALSETVASRIFGQDDPIGKVLTLTYRGRSADYKVGAVYRLPRGNTVLTLPAFIRLEMSVFPEYLTTSWLNTGPELYLKLSSGVSAEAINSQLAVFIDQYSDLASYEMPRNIAPSTRMEFELQNIRDIYLNSPWDSFHKNLGNRIAVYAFAAIAALLLFIACINFIILTTAKASLRVKEIVVRKSLGASHRQLFSQFFGEAFVYVVLAMLLALALTELFTPIFSAFTGQHIEVDFSGPVVYLASIVLVGMVSLASGLYPAILLPAFKPAQILKSGMSSGDSKTPLTSTVLVVFQFSISIALLVATAVIYAQIQFSIHRDLGFNGNNLLVLEIDDPQMPQADVLRDRLLQQPNITHAALSYAHPPQASVGYYGVSYYLPDTERARVEIRTSDIGEGFFETYQIDMVAGRSYLAELDATLIDDYSGESGDFIDRHLIINESAARYFGFDSPQAAIGETVFMPELGEDEREMRFTIIGVSADTQFFSLKATPQPWMFHFAPDYTNYLTLRYKNLSPAGVIAEVRILWQEVMGDVSFNTGFVDQYMAEEMRQETLESDILSTFSLLTVFIACMGLFGLSAFTVDRRTKEIGLRKVMGATIRQITALFLWQFSKPVLLANILAWPVAAWVMMSWLQRFPDQIALWLLLPFSLAAGVIVLVIAGVTVAGTSVRAASQKPVSALRYE